MNLRPLPLPLPNAVDPLLWPTFTLNWCSTKVRLRGVALTPQRAEAVSGVERVQRNLRRRTANAVRKSRLSRLSIMRNTERSHSCRSDGAVTILAKLQNNKSGRFASILRNAAKVLPRGDMQKRFRQACFAENAFSTFAAKRKTKQNKMLEGWSLLFG